MLAAFIIVFREMIEAGLIVGIVLTATQGISRRGYWIALGVSGGVCGACLLALFAGRLGALFAGSGQEVFNAAVLIIAVAMLAWHNIWMARHGRELAKNLKQVGAEVSAGRQTLKALAIVVGIAVLREGAEVVLFLYGVIVSGGITVVAMTAGIVLGILGGAVVSAGMYGGLLRIPARHLFRVTSILITIMAAGLAAQAISFLQQAGYVEFGTATVWNSSAYLSQASIPGRIFHTLLGYTDTPTWAQLGIYLLTLAMISFFMSVLKTGNPQPKPQALS